MRQHLYRNKNLCPGSLNDIVLTDDIKEKIMINRIYHIKDEVKVMNQTINNFNTMNNYVAGMDAVEKIMKLANYKQLELVDFETRVEDEFRRNVRKLENDGFKKGFSLKHSDFMDIIDTLTKAIPGNRREDFIEHINFIYDAKKKRIRVYNASETWEDYLVSAGLNYLIAVIAGSYLESYEVYLIRKMTSTNNVLQNTELRKCIEDYYYFLSCFEIQPYVKGKYDAQALHNKDSPEYDEEPESNDTDAHVIVDRYSKIYADIYDNITNAQKRQMQKEVLDIIKSNSQNNVSEIDKDIIGLINIDAGFKLQVMEA